MNILVVHNFYRQKGGEYSVFQNEIKLLKSQGHSVFTYTRDNDINDLLMSYEFLFNCTWSKKTYREVYSLIREKGIDIVHVHNFFPLISPSVFYAAKDAGAETVFTLHNYRIIDPGALLFNNGSIDESPVGDVSIFKMARQQRYRDSFLQTLRAGRMIDYHRRRRTWVEKVDSFIALTSFARSKFTEAGLPEKKIDVKPNFLNDPYDEYPNLANINHTRKSGFVYVGRISREKGIRTLVDAWKKIPEHVILSILGDGPLKEQLVEETKFLKNIEWLGFQPKKEVFKKIKLSKALLLPSICYEGFPMTILEAFSLGTSVITSGIGGQASIVDNEETGNLFRPGSNENFVKLILEYENNVDYSSKLGNTARKVYEENYTPQRNYELLMNIYNKLLFRNA